MTGKFKWHKDGIDNPPVVVYDLDNKAGGEAYLEYSLLELRKLRDKGLVDSDWTQMSDSPLTLEVQAEWKVYRQALRDLPANNPTPEMAFPEDESQPFTNVTWPNKPE